MSEGLPDAWAGSHFAWLHSLPPSSRRTAGGNVVAGWLAARGFNISRAPDSDADRLVEGRRAEIKFSTLWANGSYKFQQLRDQNYDFAICLGVSPFSAHCWAIPKSDILRLWRKEHKIRSQHGGSSGSDTAWIDVHPDRVPEWMSKFGGSLSEGIRQVGRLTGYRARSVREEAEGDYG